MNRPRITMPRRTLLTTIMILAALATVGLGAFGWATGKSWASLGQRVAKAGAPAPANAGVLLPDLRTLPPEGLHVDYDDETDEKVLRLSNTVWNSGEGPLEMRAASAAGETRVSQVLHDGGGPAEAREVGRFVLHGGHDHWHFEDFSLYEVWALTPEGELDTLVASSGKVTFCVMETTQVDDELAGSTPQGDYGGCGDEVQGMSAGWGDTYHSALTGQGVNITAVPNGRYALRSTADPDDRLREIDDRNNSGITYFALRGEEVEELDGT